MSPLLALLILLQDPPAEETPVEVTYRDGLRFRARDGYLFATWYLTGESKVPNTRVVPAREWGALEVAARVSYVRLANVFSSGIASPAGNTDHLAAVSAGVTWWFERNLRVTVSAIRERYSDPLGFDNRQEDAQWGLVKRLQVDF